MFLKLTKSIFKVINQVFRIVVIVKKLLTGCEVVSSCMLGRGSKCVRVGSLYTILL